MRDSAPQHDHAAVLMSLEMVGRLLGRTDDVASVASFIASQLRELTGARAVALVCWPRADVERFDVLCTEPPRRSTLTTRPEFARLAARVQAAESAALWTRDQADMAELLVALGQEACVAVPLRLSDRPLGGLIALGVQVDEFLPSIMAAQTRMAPVITLLLQQALLIAEQSSLLAQRQAAEQSLRWELRVNQALAAVSRTLCAPDLSITDVGQVALQAALSVSGSTDGGVAQVASDGAVFVHAATDGMAAECRLLRPSGACQLCREVPTGTRAAQAPSAVMVARPALGQADGSGQAVLVAPVYLGGELAGQVIVCREGEPYLDRNIDALVQVAELYGLALQRGRAEVERAQLEERLWQAGKMEAVGRLAGGVAHDFNNLLTAIIGFAEFVDTSLEPQSDLHADVGEILKAAERAADLTRQLLAYSRRQVSRREVLSLNSVVTDLEPILTRLVGENVRLTFDLADDAGLVSADRGQLGQVLMNLAANAKSAMPDGGRLVIRTQALTVGSGEAHARPDLTPGPYSMMSVTDTGCGMDAATRKRIFEPFYTTRGVGEGTGLGLATAFGIAEQHQGTIECSSEVGRGATFRVLLPCTDGSPVAAAAPATRRPLGGSETLLVVEDEDGLRELCGRALRQHGYTVIEAESAESALRLVEAGLPRIDLLITDVVMPGMNGVDLARRLVEQGIVCPVVLVSGYAGPAIDPGQLGPLDVSFVQKPYSPTSLIEEVRARLDGVGQPPNSGVPQ